MFTSVRTAVNSKVRPSGWSVANIWAGPACRDRNGDKPCVLCAYVTSWLSLTCPQRPSRRSCTESVKSSSHRRIIFKMHFNIVLSRFPAPSGLFPAGFKILYTLLLPPTAHCSINHLFIVRFVCLIYNSGCWFWFSSGADWSLCWNLQWVRTAQVVKLTNHRHVVPMLTLSCQTTYIYIYIYIYIYMSYRTTNLQMLHFIYYSTNIRTEYFKHAAHSPFFFLFKKPFIS